MQVSPIKFSPCPHQNSRESYDLNAIGDVPKVGYLPLSQGLHITPDPFSDVTHGSTNGKRHKKQWYRWSQEVIPSLLYPYFHYLRLSQSLKIRLDIMQTFCNSMCNCRHLMVMLVTFEGTIASDLILNIY